MISPFNNVMNKILSACCFFLLLFTFDWSNFDDRREIRTSVPSTMQNALLNVERD
jgi:hypothetical protein